MFPFSRRSSKHKSTRKHSPRRRYFESLETRSLLTTFTVLNTNDRGAGSLRQAIIDSNFHLGADTISFATTGTISLRSALPTIFGTVDINGKSAPGYSGVPKVKVDFNNRDGLRFNTFADNSALRGLSLIDAGNSAVTLVGTSGMLIVGNFIGVGLDGTSVSSNDGNGILLLASHDNTIGGAVPDDCNVISGNRGAGIELIGSRRNDILGNCIGVDSTGELDRGNAGSGIVLTALSYKNVIGGEERNVISGNDGNGILINGLARRNTIDGNLIGTDMSGQDALGNRHDGVRMQLTDHNVVGHENVDLGFQLSNVISGNHGNGIAMYGAFDNHVAMNYIGTDLDGTAALGNGGHGVLISTFAANNLIGGTATGGNDPTQGSFVQPPLGNVISGNSLDGVHISGHAFLNQLSGNFIGTDGGGSTALGNHGDGVAIVNANHNALIGCDFQQNPFVYYNVLSGNLHNGLRVTDSDHTTIQANFFGMGADNATPVGNAENGVLVEGDSRRTTMGGPIPLGNVSAANGENGIFVRGTSSYFISYNTFTGLAAFSSATTNGNGADGIKITSTGGNNYLRTNVVSNNHDDGIDVGGKASGVRITGNIVGMDTYGFTAMGNANNGIEIGEDAHDILIGGPQPVPNVVPQNTISDNGGNGIAVLDQANHVTINASIIGLDVVGAVASGNGASGVLLGAGTHDNTIGSFQTTNLATVVSGNVGDGIQINGSHNSVYGTLIGTDSSGVYDRGNGGNGVLIGNGGSHNLIGSTTKDNPGNTIRFNDGNGVYVRSGDSNTIRRNSIFENIGLGIRLAAGANHDQTAPVLTPALQTPTLIQISGKLTSRANALYTIEFFANDSSGPEGQTFLGSETVTTNSKGVATFVVQGSLPPSGTTHITATATSVDGDTSQFSNSALIIDVPDFTPGIYLILPSW